MSFLRAATILTTMMIAALYAVRFTLDAGIRKYAEPLAKLLNPDDEGGYTTWDQRVLRLHEIVFLLHDAEGELVDVERALDKALAPLGFSSEYTPVLKRSLIENVRIGQMHGLFTDENRALIAHGEFPRISEGIFTGETMDAQSVIPGYLAPQIGMNFANLIYTPHTIAFSNQSPTTQKVDRANGFYTASIISSDTLHYILRAIGAPPS